MSGLPELESLSIEQCFELMDGQPIGRVAVASIEGPPLVVPVNFVLDGASVVFRSDLGEKIEALGQRVSFEVDWIDPLHHTGWSVLLHGPLSLIAPEEVEHLRLDPWVGPRTLWLRIVPDIATGRRISFTLPDTDGRGYR